jgi:DtxR family Mn-dependent transcriptional regulator
MASSAMQRYAAEIYRLQQDEEVVSLSLLGEHIEASAQATASMVKKLRRLGYLEHELYRGVRLTAAGEKIAMPAIRRHRITEVYLVKAMKYDWAAAHELADIFEKGLNEELEDRVFELSGRPTHCPHGEPIPSKEGILPALNDLPLVDVPTGSTCVISRVRTHDPERLRYIAELGLTPGTLFTLLSCAPFHGPLRLLMDRNDPVIGYELSKLLWVRMEHAGPGNKLPPVPNTPK